MEPLLPSEVARLIYGYLKKENNDDAAECFLKTSPHLTECYQMFRANRNFNIKVNGFSLHDIFENFGTMCSMINEHVPDHYESKTLIAKLEYLLNGNKKIIKLDKFTETENLKEKIINEVVISEDKNLHLKNVSTNLNISSFPEINTNDDIETNKTNMNHDSANSSVNNSNLSTDKMCIVNNDNELNHISEVTENINFTKSQKSDHNSSKQIEKQKKFVTPKCQQSSMTNLQFCSPKNIQNQCILEQSECISIPEATPLNSMPGLAGEDKSKETSVIIDTGELVDTFLNDQSLLEKLADTINKSLETKNNNINENQFKEGQILDLPTLEKALDSTQSDPQIKNVLDEFLVFNVDNGENNKKNETDIQLSPIKSRLRSAKKKDDSQDKKKNNMNNSKHVLCISEECKKIDNNIVLVNDGNNKSAIIDNYAILSNPITVQANSSSSVQSFNFDSSILTSEILPEDYPGKSNYVKIAPKITPLYVSQQGSEKHIFPKRKRKTLEECGVKSKFRKSNFPHIQPINTVSPAQSIVIQVPNQSSIEAQLKKDIFIENIIRLPEVSKKSSSAKENISHSTPDARKKPPKNKSMSTPRRRSTHIRCLDFSTPQPKNNAKEHARSKLFCDSPIKVNKIKEESPSSPTPKLQADWGSVNGFESIVEKKNAVKCWDSDIREMVGAGILTTDVDIRKTRKSPRKKKGPKKKAVLNIDNDSESVLNSQDESPTLGKDNLYTNQPVDSSLALKTNNETHSVVSTDQIISKDNNLSSSLEDLNKNTCLNSDHSKISNTSINSCILQDNQHQLGVELNVNVQDDNNLLSLPLRIDTPVDLTGKSNGSTSLNKTDESLKDSNSKNLVLSLCDLNSSYENTLKDSIISGDKDTKTNILETPYKDVETLIVRYNKNNLEPISKIPQLDNAQLENYHQNIVEVNSHCNKLDSIKSHIFDTPCKPDDKNSSSSNTLLAPTIKYSENNKDKKDISIENLTIINSKSNSALIIERKQCDNITSVTKRHVQSNKSKKMSKNQLIEQRVIVESPYKYDDAAVDVPGTPISKFLLECDPRKLETPLPSSPGHVEETLMETPLTKVFRETSYLNRPPISPFPPTPGNSRSVDTVITPPCQESIDNLNSQQEIKGIDIESKINGLKEISVSAIESVPCNKTNQLILPNKNKGKHTSLKSKNGLRNSSKKTIEAKKKQVYESVKVELFGSEITSSSSGDELEEEKLHNSTKTPKQITSAEKTGFESVPQKTLHNSAEPLHSKTHLSTFLKPSLIQNEKTQKLVDTMVVRKNKKQMVHFDDPVEIIMYRPLNIDQNKSISKSITKNALPKNTLKQIKSTVHTVTKPEQLTVFNKNLNTPIPSSDNKIIKTANILKTKKKLNVSDTRINYADEHNGHKSTKPPFINSFQQISPKPKVSIINETGSMSFKDCVLKEANKDNDTHSISIESNLSLDVIVPVSKNISKTNMNNSTLNKSNQSSESSFSGITNNTSCVTTGHKETSKIQTKCLDQFCVEDFFKNPKVYDIITEDDQREMVCLELSSMFTLLDIPSDFNTTAPLIKPLNSSTISNNSLNVTPELEVGELNDGRVLLPVTSTPKDIVDIRSTDKQNRTRRSPSFWGDSVHNYSHKHREDRHRDLNYRRNKSYRENRYSDQNYRQSTSHSYRDEWLQSDNRNKYQRNHFKSNSKREFGDEPLRDKDRFKHKDDRRRSNRDYRIYDDRKKLDVNEQCGSSQKMSLNDNQKSSRSEDIVKKATKRSKNRSDLNEIPPKVSKVEHQRLLKNVNVDDFLSIVHGQ
ncbi:probable serine/threonine-protein kinase DDB_G0282963 isoform X2 [Adelges cooleyi]|uniref:probable serine/threonine-protein kinase DDB_G0282963 isoform X2 n=1 Tax=Adelges cooleyi TaxID=133065 RepID=UPI00217FB26D|nr:probable serine/threonine-protein kinase DDB_G0282963 isoform X2 [Adelges cooleyi]